jgi:hypothetical protein
MLYYNNINNTSVVYEASIILYLYLIIIKRKKIYIKKKKRIFTKDAIKSYNIIIIIIYINNFQKYLTIYTKRIYNYNIK